MYNKINNNIFYISMTKNNSQNKYFWFEWLSHESILRLSADYNGDINIALLDLTQIISDKIMWVLSKCDDEDINTINNAENFNDVKEIFDSLEYFCDNEYLIIEARFNSILENKKSEK